MNNLQITFFVNIFSVENFYNIKKHFERTNRFPFQKVTLTVFLVHSVSKFDSEKTIAEK